MTKLRNTVMCNVYLKIMDNFFAKLNLHDCNIISYFVVYG